MRKNEGLMKIAVVALVIFALMSVAVSVGAGTGQEGTIKWQWKTDSNASICNTPAIGPDGNIYVTAGVGGMSYHWVHERLFCISPQGSMLWKSQELDHCGTSDPVIASDGTIYVVGYYKLYAFNPDGTLKWDWMCPAEVWDPSCPHAQICGVTLGADGTIYTSHCGAGAYARHLFALNPDGTLKWAYSTESIKDVGDLTVGKDGVLYGELNRFLYAFNPDNGAVLWSTDLEGCYVNQGGMAIGADGTIYVPLHGTPKLATITLDGTIKWEYDMASPGIPSIGSDGTIYVTGGKLYALTSSGQLKWTASDGSTGAPEVAIASDGTIYSRLFHSGKGHLLTAVNPDGSIKWTLEIPFEAGTPAIGSDGTIYVTGGRFPGVLTAVLPTPTLTPASTPAPTPKVNHLSCENKDNEEKGCCCFLEAHTYRFGPQYVSSVVVTFDTGRKFNCHSTVQLQVDKGKGWETIKSVEAVSSSGDSEFAPIEVEVPVADTILGFRIYDGCVCCIDFSEIFVYGGAAPTPTHRPTAIATPMPTPTPAPTPGKLKKCVGDQPYLYVEDRVMGKGKTVEIPIMMCNAKELANMDIDWSYNAAVLKIIDVTKGSLNKKALFDWNEVSPGKLKTSFASSKGVTGSGSIAVMKFEVVGNPGDTSTLTGTVTTASKTDGSKITVGVNPGKFTVGTSPVKGDCDGDNALTVKDALAALQMSVEKRAVDMCYDYNDDGKVNSADARDMLKAIVGK